MATYLQLCQQVASDSATFAEGAISTVTGQTGRKAKVVRMVNQAWRSIQNAHHTWNWMRSSMTLTLSEDTRYYAGSSGTDMFGDTRFGEFLCQGLGDNRFMIYDSTIGLSDKAPMQFVPYDTFYARDLFNEDTGKPVRFTIAPDGRLAVHQIPDGNDYKIIAPYRKSIQTLSADSDTPEMPADFHDVIASLAVQFIHLHDEATGLLPLWKLRENFDFCRLEARQLPAITIPEPLA
jgi:hypothetical protein